VRLFDLGKPHVELDDQGHIKNAEGSYIDDCLYMDMWTYYWTMQQVDFLGHPLPPPPEPWPPPDWLETNPDWLVLPSSPEVWADYLQGLAAVHVQVVTMTGLQAGEVVEQTGFEHAATVTADGSGRAVVPVVQSVRHGGRLEPGKIMRVSRTLGAQVAVQTAVFHREASFAAGRSNRLVTTPDGSAFVVAEFDDRTETYRLGSLGGWARVENDLVPQPPDEPAEPKAAGIDLPGLVSVIRLPGFADEPVALAAMDDGSTLVLDLTGDRPRVAGKFR